MQKIKIKIILIFFLLISKLSYAQEYYQASDLFVQETIDLLTQNNSEHNWYGFYLIDKLSGDQIKLGYARQSYDIVINEQLEKTFTENFFFKSIFKVMDDEFHTEGMASQIFNAEYPYNLISSFVTTVGDDGSSSYEISKVDEGLSTYLSMENNIHTEKKIENFSYSLHDYFAPLFAINHDNLQVGDKFNAKWLDLGEVTTAINEIEEISVTNLYGGRYEFAKIKSLQQVDGKEEELSTYLTSNKFLTLVLLDNETTKIEFRLESESDAKNLDKIKDLFVLNSIKVDNGILGSEPFDILAREITDLNPTQFESHEIVYEIIGEYNDILEDDYTNQRVFKNDQGTFIQLGALSSDYVRETVDQKYYDEAAAYMLDNPELFRIASDIVFLAEDDAVKLDSLLYHMENYEYVNRMNEITDPYQILEYGGGDCTELSDLFIALVKSLGIPARRVVGFARQDDSFGGHQWAEVAFDGQWWSVDPTWLLWSGFSANHLKIKDEKQLSDIPFKLRVSEIKSTISDFSVSFTKDGKIIY